MNRDCSENGLTAAQGIADMTITASDGSGIIPWYDSVYISDGF